MGADLKQLRDFFYKNGTRVNYRHKNIIIYQGEPITDVFFITRGIYKIYSIDELGEERTISVSGKNSILPITWLSAPVPEHAAYYFYEAFTDVVVYRASQEAFKKMLDENINLVYYLLDETLKSYVNLASRVTHLQKSKIEEKTEFILYFLAMRLGSSKDGKIFEIEKPVTQQDIASLTGVTRETAARFLLRMQSSEMAWKKGSNYYIDISKLNTNYKTKVF